MGKPTSITMTRASRSIQAPQDRTGLIQVPLLGKLPWLVHGFTTRQGGVSSFSNSKNLRGKGTEWNLGKVAWDSERNVLENRRRLLARLEADGSRLVVLRQVHSDLVRVLDETTIPEDSPGAWAGDGLVTTLPGLLLAILVADCLPVLLADTRQRVVAALHCGWRGTARRLAQKGVGIMKQQFGSREQDLRAAIGPGIRPCCYEVGEEVKEEFEGQFPYARELFTLRHAPPDPLQAKYPLLFNRPPKGFSSSGLTAPQNRKWYLDLVLANVCQLREAGVAPRRIYSKALCTSCHPEWFFSHRRDQGRTGRMMGVIGIRKQ